MEMAFNSTPNPEQYHIYQMHVATKIPVRRKPCFRRVSAFLVLVFFSSWLREGVRLHSLNDTEHAV